MKYLFITVHLFIFSLFTQKFYSQDLYPLDISTTSQSLSFGAFTHGSSGGTVSISAGGLRTSTGEVVLLSMGYSFSSALFEISDDQGTVLSVIKGADILLTGSNGGTLSLSIGELSPAGSIVVSNDPPSAELLYVGGTISIGDLMSNPPGAYSGTFEITLVQE